MNKQPTIYIGQKEAKALLDKLDRALGAFDQVITSHEQITQALIKIDSDNKQIMKQLTVLQKSHDITDRDLRLLEEISLTAASTQETVKNIKARQEADVKDIKSEIHEVKNEVEAIPTEVKSVVTSKLDSLINIVRRKENIQLIAGVRIKISALLRKLKWW